MADEFPLTHRDCFSCGRPGGARAFSLDVMNAHDIDGGSIWETSVDGVADAVANFCDKDCWEKGGRLVRTFPIERPHVPCGRCGTSIDRREGYLLVSLADEEFIDEQVIQDSVWDFAILCRSCSHSLIVLEDARFKVGIGISCNAVTETSL